MSENDWIEIYEERAGIHQYFGKLSRERSEALAAEYVKGEKLKRAQQRRER